MLLYAKIVTPEHTTVIFLQVLSLATFWIVDFGERNFSQAGERSCCQINPALASVQIGNVCRPLPADMSNLTQSRLFSVTPLYSPQYLGHSETPLCFLELVGLQRLWLLDGLLILS